MPEVLIETDKYIAERGIVERILARFSSCLFEVSVAQPSGCQHQSHARVPER